jgi:hypothetical protein
LEPGLHPLYLGDPFRPERLWGHALSRPDRPASFLSFRLPEAGSRPLLSLELPGFRLLPDGSVASAPGGRALIRLLGEVARSRALFGGEFFLLRFRSLVRVLD